MEEAVGGAGNVARNIASLEAHCDLLGMVGTDEGANAICRCLSALPNIEGHLVHAPERVTTVKSRFVAKLHNTHLLRADVEDLLIEYNVEQKVIRIAAEMMSQIDAVLLSDYSKGLLSDAVVRNIIDTAHGAGKLVVVDRKGRRYERYAGAHFMTPNLIELGQAVGVAVDTDEHQLAAARKLLEMTNGRAVLVTRGENGVLVVPANGEATFFVASARRVIDVSGAGDTLAASFTLALASGASVVNAARLANVAAGIAVSKFGTASVTHEELSGACSRDPTFTFSQKSSMPGRRCVRSW